MTSQEEQHHHIQHTENRKYGRRIRTTIITTRFLLDTPVGTIVVATTREYCSSEIVAPPSPSSSRTHIG
eukprot:CAMPEP_0170782474 /NCGR_PEP_ID=MMETSP0733-20121128/14898_1 /TAXON_ID=186038 /ORGANISM="Fragilariopsis kerguelensis, Strain L26-C5" /LENGTH=68 /DNA_ID=CAMNT_0011126875 /DNA_START=80 /DNA_END=282 /DNA_ORIENTATION=-